MDWFSPMPTQEANAPPQPLCENLLARPCNPPLCVRRPPRIPTSEFASPEASVFPLAAPSIESRRPIILLLLWLVWFFEGETVVIQTKRRRSWVEEVFCDSFVALFYLRHVERSRDISGSIRSVR